MKPLRFEGVKLVHKVAAATLGTSTIACIQGSIGSGKTTAAHQARAKLSIKGIPTRVLLLNCELVTDRHDLARVVATKIGFKIGSLSTQGIFDRTQEELRGRHIRLIIANDADEMSATAQNYLLKLSDPVPSAKKEEEPHKIGLVVLVTDDKSFVETASSAGYQVLKHAMPKLTGDEVATYLQAACPHLEADLRRADNNPLAQKLIGMLYKYSGQRLRPLERLVAATLVALEPNTKADLATFHRALTQHLNPPVEEAKQEAAVPQIA